MMIGITLSILIAAYLAHYLFRVRSLIGGTAMIACCLVDIVCCFTDVKSVLF